MRLFTRQVRAYGWGEAIADHWCRLMNHLGFDYCMVCGHWRRGSFGDADVCLDCELFAIQFPDGTSMLEVAIRYWSLPR